MPNRNQKPIKYIDQVKGPLIKLCPGAKNCFCCNYVVISQIINCPYDCSYCYLHAFFGRDEIVVYRHEEKIIDEVKAYLEAQPQALRIGTGEYSDSLALPEALALGKTLIGLFAKQKKDLLELKTKSDNIDEILNLNHQGQTVIAWSVNPEIIVNSEEHGAATLLERLKAAQKCAAHGYQVAFHFDPIIYFDNWKDEYNQVVKYIFNYVSPEDIAWISLGALRFPAAQKKIMIEKFSTQIFFDYFELGEDKKLRYPQALKVELFRHIYQAIRIVSSKIYIYLCMESESAWKKVGIINPITSYFSWKIR